MNCTECETLILDQLDDHLPEHERQALAAHLKDCPACRHFLSGQKALDARLSSAIQRPELSADFKQRMLHRVDIEFAGETSTARARKKELLEAEFQTASAKLRHGLLGPFDLLDLLGWAATAVFCAVILSYWLAQSAALFQNWQVPARWNTDLSFAWICAGGSVLVGLWVGWQRRAFRWLF